MIYVLFGTGYLLFGIFYTIAVMRWLPDISWTPNTSFNSKEPETCDISLSIIFWPISAFFIFVEISFTQISKLINCIVKISKHRVQKPDDNQ